MTPTKTQILPLREQMENMRKGKGKEQKGKEEKFQSINSVKESIIIDLLGE